ncbi:hypothetical protein EDD15DRAFT_2204532 [Pisolithus albus]|nr:hypothetical protein EDD15DRAFT_2204532 [Pisolithus albus]
MTSSNVRSVFGVLVGDFKRSANALGVSSRSCYLWREILEEHGSVNQPPSLLAGRAQTVTRASLDSSWLNGSTRGNDVRDFSLYAKRDRAVPVLWLFLHPLSAMHLCFFLRSAASASSHHVSIRAALAIPIICVNTSSSAPLATSMPSIWLHWPCHSGTVIISISSSRRAVRWTSNFRVPFSTVKLAVGSTAHVFKDIIILRAFDDYIFLVLDGPASRQTTTPLDQRDWVTRYNLAAQFNGRQIC